MAFDAREFLRTLTESPGVYRMIGADEEVLYVGKAKNLKRRVSSYFQKNHPSPRIALMVSRIARVDTTAVRSETEALILENNLIKALKPRYNILFRDDKSYPYIMLSGDAFPRIAYYRGAFAKGSRYFGPFPSSWAARESVNLIQKMFRLRTCEESVFANRSRPCLLHQIKRCSAPCVALISPEDYARDVRMASMFLDGRHSEIIDQLGVQMQQAAERFAYEEAAFFRDQIRSLQTVLHKQFVDSGRDEDVDVVVAVEVAGVVCVNLAMVRGGRHLGDRPQFPQGGETLGAGDALLAFIEQHYLEHPAPTRLVVSGVVPEDARRFVDETLELRIAVVAPRFEAERAWVEMAERNAREAIEIRLRESGRVADQLDALRSALELQDAPQRIECFDISHTMGEATIASCVVWEDGGMKKSEYRRFNIAGVEPGDDYGAMRQALERRYGKVAAGEGARPDLILIDGGKGQVSVAYEVLVELGLETIAMLGVAKGEARKAGLEQLVFPDNRAPLVLGGEHAGLHLIQTVRDEAHRFAITGMRAKRAKARVGSRLDDIPGIGPTRRKKLIETFGGLAGVKEATVEDLCRVSGVNRKLAEAIYNALRD
ncbi:excinuclease ABC subunit UvrC [Niveibacterium umoris]|uniref:UvrABC system protein C n=1 Tax=Niveibacterium umoris TaxID=1193620 RepID=A0A840BH35_9RHOO|nr:excinuclease ABC subunit UvrC [Niveibacterium umoris]MBB4010912.1 excinuclease ABC subunit C [Niveibacterium umoris]